MADFRATHIRSQVTELLVQDAAARAQVLRNEIVEQLSQPGKGRTYEFEREFQTANGIRQVGARRSAPHTASAPGDPPAVDTGRLRQSITALKIGPGHWRVGTNVKYAIFLEFGTRRIAPRPFVRTAVAKVKQRG